MIASMTQKRYAYQHDSSCTRVTYNLCILQDIHAARRRYESIPDNTCIAEKAKSTLRHTNQSTWIENEKKISIQARSLCPFLIILKNVIEFLCCGLQKLLKAPTSIAMTYKAVEIGTLCGEPAKNLHKFAFPIWAAITFCAPVVKFGHHTAQISRLFYFVFYYWKLRAQFQDSRDATSCLMTKFHSETHSYSLIALDE